MAQVTMEVCVCTGCMLCGSGEILKTSRELRRIHQQMGEDFPLEVKTYLDHRRSVSNIYPQVIINRRLMASREEKDVWAAVMERCQTLPEAQRQVFQGSV